MALNLTGNILREASLIFSKNGKLMVSITLLALTLYSIIYLSLTFSTKPLLLNKLFTLPTTSPGNPEYEALLIVIQHDFGDITGIKLILFLAQFFTSVFFATATIFASAVIYDGKNISPKDLLSRILRSWIRPFITGFYMILFAGGFHLFVLATMLPILRLVETPFVLYVVCIAVFIIAATIFYCYLAVEFILALVVSVIEEKSGIEALGKAGELAKGRKLHAFALNIFFMILMLISMQGLRLISITMSTSSNTLVSLLVFFVHLFQMFWFITYTVYYHQCKKGHGEEVTLQGTLEYRQIPTALTTFLMKMYHSEVECTT